MTTHFGFCKVSISPIRAENRDQSEIVSQLLFGEIIEVVELEEPWMKIRTFADNYEGYIDFKHIIKLTEKEFKRWSNGISYLEARERTLMTPWGKQRICRGSFIPANLDEFNIGNNNFTWMDEDNTKSMSIIDFCEDYLNTPYLWGGKTPFGIDCSGFTQTVYRFAGFNLPRDASEQVDHGMEVDFEDILEGDIAFFENAAGNIHHVGILNGKGEIYHASGEVRKDKFTNEGILREDFGKITHKLNIIKRL